MAQSSLWLPSVLATLIALVGIVGGVFYSASRSRIRIALPLSALLLLGVALFGLLPEIAHDLSWFLSILLFAVGFGFLAVLDRAGVPICPVCSHDHDHHHCAAPLHGFAVPLLIAAAVHSSFDGWALAASGLHSSFSGWVLPLAIVIHKLPEGFALGGILEASLRSRWTATGLAAAAESLTLAGSAASLVFAPCVGSLWISYPLGLAGGFFVFLAYHALHNEWKRSRGHATELAE